jgi:hypothetical protein
MCFDLLTERNHVYNYSRSFKAADHIHVDVRTCTLYSTVQYSIYGRDT